jgi:REP element-mobilizing transposase RayT
MALIIAKSPTRRGRYNCPTMSKPKFNAPINPDLIVDPTSVPFAEPSFRGVLPHLFKPGCTYFVTYCLADVARSRAIERQQLRQSNEPWKVAEAIDFDPTMGSCLLKNPDLAAVVEDSLLHFQGERYALSAWCVMPNHVHAVVTPLGEHRLPRILQSWKGFSAHKINKKLNRSGRVWQKESFDHIVRDEESFERFVAYSESNPVAAGLVGRRADWPFSSARRRRDLECRRPVGVDGVDHREIAHGTWALQHRPGFL